MDVQFLHRFGLALRNAHTMLKSRGLQQCDGLQLQGQPLECAGLVYTSAVSKQVSLGQAAKSVWQKPSGEQVYLWVLDRNYDIAKNRERMASTDQIKAMLDIIQTFKHVAYCISHVIIAPSKLSPQAKKEMPDDSNIQIFLFEDLYINLCAHELILPHVVISCADVKTVLGPTLDPNDLPVLPTTDPVARWYNFKRGEIVRIDNPVMPSFRIVH